MNPNVKGFLKGAANWALLAFLMPQAFLFCYYFPFLFRWMGNAGAFLKAVSLCGLAVSWVSAPFSFVLYLAGRLCLARNVRGALVWAGSFLAGCLWLAAWNLAVCPTFGWLRSLAPVLICSTAAALYAVAGRARRKIMNYEL